MTLVVSALFFHPFLFKLLVIVSSFCAFSGEILYQFILLSKYYFMRFEMLPSLLLVLCIVFCC